VIPLGENLELWLVILSWALCLIPLLFLVVSCNCIIEYLISYGYMLNLQIDQVLVLVNY
jgi:hypothetical protein